MNSSRVWISWRVGIATARDRANKPWVGRIRKEQGKAKFGLVWGKIVASPLGDEGEAGCSAPRISLPRASTAVQARSTREEVAFRCFFSIPTRRHSIHFLAFSPSRTDSPSGASLARAASRDRRRIDASCFINVHQYRVERTHTQVRRGLSLAYRTASIRKLEAHFSLRSSPRRYTTRGRRKRRGAHGENDTRLAANRGYRAYLRFAVLTRLSNGTQAGL